MRISFFCFACIIYWGSVAGVQAQVQEEASLFRLPDIPSMLVTPEDRAAYLSVHYWDHFNFSDTSLIAREEITEQAFVNFINILPYARNAQEAVDTLFQRASVEKKMFYHFMAMGSKYLYEPNSPMYNEELFILMLRSQLGSTVLSQTEKVRPRFLLEMALKNRPGEVAADFSYLRRDGKSGRLSEIRSPYLILYFNDPECNDCLRVKRQLSSSSGINNLLRTERLALLSVCVEGKTDAWKNSTCPDSWIDAIDKEQHLTNNRVYDLKAMPTLYLLDETKRVILKDVSVSQIETWLKENGK